MIADFEGDITELLKDRESGTYPIICTRNLVIFPTVLAPLSYLEEDPSSAVAHYLKQKIKTRFLYFLRFPKGCQAG